MTSWLHRDIDGTDPTAKRTACTIWALLTGAACFVLGRAVTWASQALTLWLAAWLLVSVVAVALIAVGAGRAAPAGRHWQCSSLRPASPC